MVCEPIDIEVPDLPSGPQIPGFGSPFALNLPAFPFDLPAGFPENLLDLFNNLQLLLPIGPLKPGLSSNFGKDFLDALLSMLEKFFPFLALYKFFLPLLNLLICVVEVLCALLSPFKLRKAVKRLFRECIPAFLNLFPLLALLIMLLSLLYLLIALIEYIIQQLEKLIALILRNLKALARAFKRADSESALSIARKLGNILCIFQNIFAIMSIFALIFEVIKDILSLSFRIPPCNQASGSDCCDAEVCPAFINGAPFERSTGNLQYFSTVGYAISTNIPGFSLNHNLRNNLIQFYDPQAPIQQQFNNIYDGYDQVVSPKPVFFPTDSTFSASSPIDQVPYTVDLRFQYDPALFGRPGIKRFVRFNNCIVLQVPNGNLQLADNSISSQPTGVLVLVGGLGFEDDNSTQLKGFASDGVTQIGSQATLDNFIYQAPTYSDTPKLNINDHIFIQNVDYTFKANIDFLVKKQLITVGCDPDLINDQVVLGNTLGAEINANVGFLNGLINSSSFPNIGATQDCMNAAIQGIRNNMTPAGAAVFQATTTACLTKLQGDTLGSIKQLIDNGFNPYNSTFTVKPQVQFTTDKILVQVDLKEANGQSLGIGAPPIVAQSLSKNITANLTFGNISDFNYDGYQYFDGYITSDKAGSGTIEIAYNGSFISTVSFPTDPTVPSSVSVTQLPYQFIYSPALGGSGTSANGDQGQPYRDNTDTANDGANS